MAITVGTAAQKTVQNAMSKSSKSETHSASTQARSETHSQSDTHARTAKNALAKAALTPAIRQAAQLVAGPLGEVAVTMAAGAVGALLDTRA
jgi:hypothetical protein